MSATFGIVLPIQQLEDGSYAYTMTSYGAALSSKDLQDLFQFFGMVSPQTLEQVDEETARDGQSVVGTVTPLTPEEQKLCIC